jgi:hypothetical protein
MRKTDTSWNALTARAAVAFAVAGRTAAGLDAPAFAQNAPATQPPTLPTQPGSPQTVPEKIDPPLRKSDDPATGTTLSDQLNSSKGVIRPPANVDPEMRVPAPDVGRMPVIPPPGSPGGNQDVQPK